MESKPTTVRVFVSDWERAMRFYVDTLEMVASYRSDDVGWAQRIVEERIDRDLPADLGPERAAGIQIGIEPREVAAGDLHPQAVARLEDLRRCAKVDIVTVDLPWCVHLWPFEGGAIACAQDAVAD